MLTQDQANAMFEYRNGDLFWKIKASRKVRIGEKVGSPNDGGYMRTTINYKPYRLHRVIFLMHHGYMPENIDHIDGNPSNNKIENLREATKSQNGMNVGIKKNNTSGVKGVCWHKGSSTWRAIVAVNGKQITLGYYKDLERAKESVLAARAVHHKEFARS